MTEPEPDPVAALAAQLEELREELRGRLLRAEGSIGQARARLDSESGQVLPLLLEVRKLRERLDDTEAKHKLAPPPAPYWLVGQAEGEAMLAELREWVETFLRRHYPGYMDRVPRCWANHPEAVWELSTLRAEWQRIYADEDNRELAGALTWHDRYLPSVVGRLAAAIRCEDLMGCSMRRGPPA